MKREILFRAWDGTRMYHFTNHEWTLDFNDISGWNVVKNLPLDQLKGRSWDAGESSKTAAHFDLMQFTGLQDKKGKDIYEGDIVELFWSFAGASYFCKVFWFQERACWAMVEKGKGDYDGIFHYFGSQDTKLKDVEVLGNMYEPHLLKA